jgi:hypothetical protein
MLREALAGIHRLPDLRLLISALGYTPEWQELAPGTFGAGQAALTGRQGEFEWYALLQSGEASVKTAARILAARGIPAAVLGFDPAIRLIRLGVSGAPLLRLDLDDPEPLALGRLERCRARPDELALAAVFRIADALSSSGVDQRFFAAFRGTLARVMESVPPRIPLGDRHALGLLQLTRILFLYFVEARGWLGNRRLLREEVDRCLAAGRSLHRDLLDPLFFGTLNRPYSRRSRLARRFGPVPFLNGGLFEPHPLERRWRVTLPTPVLRDAFDDLFERFHFTLTDQPGETVAPDMLGRVFEGVMEPAERHATGSYYTPASLVEAMVREALAAWLAGRLGLSTGEAERRLADPDLLTRRTLRGVRLLDPAAGSGAFLLGALRVLAGPSETRHRGRRLRAILGGCLFGVDRNPAAVRLAELRLWLEVIAGEPDCAPERIAPLPNLDGLIRQGDSLTDPVRGTPWKADPRLAGLLRQRRSLLVNATGAAKQSAVRALQRTERETAEALLRTGIGETDRAIEELLETGRSSSLFGERRGLIREERLALARLRASRADLRGRLRHLTRTGAIPWFHYPVHFADVCLRGGFDLVVGNPPWVRAESLPPAERAYLSERFRWFRPERTGNTGYPHLPDLSVAFLERALDLVAPGGIVGFLVPAKLATSGYATRARAELSRTATIVVAADLRSDARASFDATVYPMALVVRRAEPSRAHRVSLSLSGQDGGELAQHDLGGSAWPLVRDSVRATMSRLQADYPPLSDRYPCQLGVKTGYNRAFLDPPETVEPELIRWAIRGRDIEPFRVRARRRILWPCDPAGRPLDILPPGASHHLEGFAGALRRRSDHQGRTDRLWTLYRTGPASARHRVIWADLERQLTAAPLSGNASAALIPLNTCYVVPVRDGSVALRLAAWLNSTWCRVLAALVADPASGGFYRFNARVVSGLPAPPALFGDNRLLELGRDGVAGTLDQKDLDDRTAELLDLSGSERERLAALAPGSAQPGRRDARAG